jgi:hypothetical protein
MAVVVTLAAEVVLTESMVAPSTENVALGIIGPARGEFDSAQATNRVTRSTWRRLARFGSLHSSFRAALRLRDEAVPNGLTRARLRPGEFESQ